MLMYTDLRSWGNMRPNGWPPALVWPGPCVDPHEVLLQVDDIGVQSWPALIPRQRLARGYQRPGDASPLVRGADGDHADERRGAGIEVGVPGARLVVDDRPDHEALIMAAEHGCTSGDQRTRPCRALCTEVGGSMRGAKWHPAPANRAQAVGVSRVGWHGG